MASSGNDFKLVDYRLFLAVGIIFLVIGALARQWGMGAFGILLLGIALINKSKWGQEKQWSQLTADERKRQIRGLVTGAIIGLALFLLPLILGLS